MGYTITPEIESYAHAVKEKYGVPESVTLGQAIYESQLGQSNMAQQANNWFGLKGSGTAGSYSSRGSNWQKYNNVSESFDAYGKLLTNDRYTKYTKNATTTSEYLQGIVQGGYCSDAGYVTDVLNIINSNGLEKYNTSQYTGSDSGGILSGLYDATVGTALDGAKGVGSKILTGVFIVILFIMSILCIIKIFA